MPQPDSSNTVDWEANAELPAILNVRAPDGATVGYVAVAALLTDEAIETAACALNLDAGRQRGLTFHDDWETLTEQERGGWRLCARAAFNAVTSREKHLDWAEVAGRDHL